MHEIAETRAERETKEKQRPIHVELAWSDHATALGTVVKGGAPVLQLCRLLIEAGHDPATPLEAWRGGTLCLRIRAIGDAAGMCVSDDNIGRPRFRRQRTNAAASPIRKNAEPSASTSKPLSLERWRFA
jgi:hypothetical protein